MAETWTTGTLAVTTDAGVRYIGVSYIGLGRPHDIPRMPRPGLVRYTTRPRREARFATEDARGRTIHHNLWHDGSGLTAHHRRDSHCMEGRTRAALAQQIQPA